MREEGLFGNESVAGNLFDDATFKAFVFDFYYDQEDYVDDAWGDVMRHIFGDSDMYRRFIEYCRGHNYGFLSEDERTNYKIQVCLLIFEQARQGVINNTVDKLHDILDIQLGSVEYQNTTNIIPGTHTSYWAGLQASIHAGIPLNNHGELVYIIGKNGELYHVYSHERGLHYIDSQGNMKDIGALNAKRRVHLRKQIDDFKLVLELVKEERIKEDRKLVGEIARLFKIDNNMMWNENNLSRLRFRSWLGEKIIEMEKDFDDLVGKDSRKPDLRVVSD